jgi:hypothetical protein
MSLWTFQLGLNVKVDETWVEVKAPSAACLGVDWNVLQWYGEGVGRRVLAAETLCPQGPGKIHPISNSQTERSCPLSCDNIWLTFSDLKVLSSEN